MFEWPQVALCVCVCPRVYMWVERWAPLGGFRSLFNGASLINNTSELREVLRCFYMTAVSNGVAITGLVAIVTVRARVNMKVFTTGISQIAFAFTYVCMYFGI